MIDLLRFGMCQRCFKSSGSRSVTATKFQSGMKGLSCHWFGWRRSFQGVTNIDAFAGFRTSLGPFKTGLSELDFGVSVKILGRWTSQRRFHFQNSNNFVYLQCWKSLRLRGLSRQISWELSPALARFSNGRNEKLTGSKSLRASAWLCISWQFNSVSVANL